VSKVWTPRAVRFQELHRLLNRARQERERWSTNPNRFGGAAAESLRSVSIMQWEVELKSFPREYHESVTNT